MHRTRLWRSRVRSAATRAGSRMLVPGLPLAFALAAFSPGAQAETVRADRPPPVRVDTDTAQPGERPGQWRIAVPDSAQAENAKVVSTASDPAAAMVNRLFHAGRAAGLAQVIYDNRDADHSRPGLHQLPQLRETRYGETLAAKGLDQSLAGPFLFDAPVIGNASLALTRGPFKRSLPRLALQNQATAQIAYDLFAANHLYVYPEHRDHDLKTGDRYAALSPYMVVSQGSSGSDRPFLKALALTYAAFPPDTFARLRQEGLLPATAQMILRRTRKGITSDAAYFSPSAHPSAFDGESLRPAAMVSLASAIRADQIAPMVELDVIQDLQASPGVDYLARNLTETLFTTPGAIARVWRSFAGQRRMEISAERTMDPNGHPLRFTWVVLRGDPEKVRITPSGPGGARAEIVMDWHGAGEITGPNGIAANRIEIGVFAHNGHNVSAPAFVSITLPLHQRREYAGKGAAAQLWRLDYGSGDSYVDPLIWPVAPWNDRLAHGPDGRVEVMTRLRHGAVAPYALHRNPAGGWLRRIDEGADGSDAEERLIHLAEGPPQEGMRLVEDPLP